MKKCAYLTCDPQEMSFKERIYYREEFSLLEPEFGKIGWLLISETWRSPRNWSGYDAAVIRTTWDYHLRLEEYLTALQKIQEQTVLLNPLATVRWNARKTYLKDLSDWGVPVVPTIWLTCWDDRAVEEAFEKWKTESLVLKPVVGAGSYQTCRIFRDRKPARVPGLDSALMLQPFMSGIHREGELSFLFFNREFAYGIVKRPDPKDFRTQEQYGGSHCSFEPGPGDILQARAVLEHIPGDLLYARVDTVRGEDHTLYLMELEVIEPFLFLSKKEGGAGAFAKAFREIFPGGRTGYIPGPFRGRKEVL